MIESVAKRDYLVRGTLADIDPDVAALVQHETARQARHLILVPSESTVPEAVREAVGSAFHNIYSEGYPPANMRHMAEADILDYPQRLAEYRRYADNRYYKGTEYANIIESLAQRRVAEVYANDLVSVDQLYINVQPLSGAPANNAVYTALVQPGDTVMSMNLVVGGHLSHGAPVNRSGKFFNIVSYEIDPSTEQLDYERMMQIALEHQPKIIIGGYSSYPMAPDWEAYRRIADACGAHLLADIAHFAGLIAADAYPSPVGIADIVTFTTHKTLNGPRGAVVMTHRKDLATKLDRGVFPGEQGGPHMNAVAGLAVAMKIAQTPEFHQLQHQTVANARRMAQRLSERGLYIPHGGTDSHMFVVDLKPIKGEDGTSLSGDMAARIFDLVGIVGNRQTIPGDTSALRPSGIRLGTPWITQRGFGIQETERLSDIIADVLFACKPFSYTGKNGARAKIDFDTFHTARLAVRDLVDEMGIDTDAEAEGYPHFSYIDDDDEKGTQAFSIIGEEAAAFLDVALTSDVYALLQAGDQQATNLLDPDGKLRETGVLEYVAENHYRLHITNEPARSATWLRSLSDGFVIFDRDDLYAKVPGPVAVIHDGASSIHTMPDSSEGFADKSYFIGQAAHQQGEALPKFAWSEPEQAALLQTPLHGTHLSLGARMAPFAGYDMPLWYDKVMTEHLAVRQTAGVFDVTHMGVFEAKGAGAARFLDVVTTNDISRLDLGTSHYTFLLDVDGVPFDDLLIYRLADDHFMLVVNASNNDKNWAWLNAVKDGTTMIDPAALARRATGRHDFVLRDLRAESSGADRRVDIALQGPKSRDILLELGGSESDLAAVKSLQWAGITRATLGGFDLLVSRTGYTGERIAYEVFPHPEQASALFERLIDLGAKPCGLAARDSLRTEAGLPLYGHELGGEMEMNPADAGMGAYVKLYKPFFIGKAAFITHEMERDAEVSRFRMDQRGARPAHQGDPVVDARGRVIGIVTSCSMDSEGYQLGQVYLKKDHRKKGTQLGVFAGAHRAKESKLSALSFGDKTAVPEPITILTRFPKRK